MTNSSKFNGNLKRKIKLPKLIKSVRNLKITDDVNSNKLVELSDSIFEEWFKLKNKLKKIKKKNLSELVYARYEADEEIVVGLVHLLNKKLINFIECNLFK